MLQQLSLEQVQWQMSIWFLPPLKMKTTGFLAEHLIQICYRVVFIQRKPFQEAQIK